ncbi:hypothetical protein EV126DRAFT_106027 [Verticillium dahliae]|nr:hypothetical protein EV126DRAFT_106027 [Verticillium dahliae]
MSWAGVWHIFSASLLYANARQGQVLLSPASEAATPINAIPPALTSVPVILEPTHLLYALRVGPVAPLTIIAFTKEPGTGDNMNR